MEFVIKGMKYNTEKMEKVAEVRKWYRVDTFLTRSMYPGKEVGRTYPCELWKSAKGNWLLTHEEDYSTYGEAIQEEEAKSLLMRHATDIYEKMFGELPEAQKEKAKPGCKVGNQNNRVGTNKVSIAQHIEK